MKARYELEDMNITVSNVTLRNAADSYVLLKAADTQGQNEITIKLSHEQSEFLEAELRDANRRRKENVGHSQERWQEEEDSFNLFSLDFLDERPSE